MSRIMHLDGATLEGGGQLVRNAVAFAALLQRPISIHNVRAGRSKPGLKAQHVAGIKLLRSISQTLDSDQGPPSIGDTSLLFSPHHITPGNYESDTGTAGATSLILQTVLPCLLFPTHHARSQSALSSVLTLRGGTNALLAPPIDYTQNVLLPFLHDHFNISISLSLFKRGFFPTGGGHVQVTIPAMPAAASLPPINLTNRGSVVSIRGIAYVSALPLQIAHFMRDAAMQTLNHAAAAHSLSNVPIQIDIEHNSSVHARPGSGIVLWANTDTRCVLGASALGQKKLQAQKIGKQAAEELLNNIAHGGCVDEHLQDQIIVFLALARSSSHILTGPLTLHTKTAIWLAETITGAKFHIQQHDNGQNTITCDGIGYSSTLQDESTVAEEPLL